MQFVSRLIEFATNHYLLVAALLVLLVLLLLHELRKGGKSLSTRELTALVNADQAVVLDIRPAKEFASGHIVDALNIPADKLNSRMTELEKYKGKTIILVDAMGQHSGTWGGVLKKAGFNAAKLSGGIGAWCPYCIRAKQLLQRKGVDFQEIACDGKPELRAELARKAGSTTVPQIWIGETHVGGCDDLHALERAGKLDALLSA